MVHAPHQLLQRAATRAHLRPAAFARGRPQVFACASSSVDEVNGFTINVTQLGCVDRHQNPRASAGLLATLAARQHTPPQPEGQCTRSAHRLRLPHPRDSSACGAGAVRRCIYVLHGSVYDSIGALSRSAAARTSSLLVAQLCSLAPNRHNPTRLRAHALHS